MITEETIMSLLCNWFDDWGRAIESGLGRTWLIVLTVALLFMALYLLQDIIRASINKTKIVIKWGEIVVFIIFSLFIAWFCYLLIN